MTPREVDEVARGLARRFAGPHGTWGLARDHRALPAPVVRALLTHLAHVPGPWSVFVRAYVGDPAAPDLAESWTRAALRLRALQSSEAWGSKRKRARLTALAQEPRLVEAVQAALVAGDIVFLDPFGVLAHEGSEASADALMPHFERAAREQSRDLDRLQLLRKYAAPTPAMTAMLARVDALLDQRRATSPALALAAHLGFGPLKAFRFTVALGAKEEGPPPFHGYVHVDHRDADWLDVGVGLGERRTHFTAHSHPADELGLGRCPPRDLPAWLAAAGRKFRRTPVALHATSNLRGMKRARIVDWLLDGR